VSVNSLMAGRFVHCARAVPEHYFRRGIRTVILQIGAHLAWLNQNDVIGGAVHDAARSRHGIALLVEPQAHIAAMLRAACANLTGAVVEQAAICPHGEEGEVPFYAISAKVGVDGVAIENGKTIHMPHWTSQVASLSRRQTVSSLPSGVHRRRRTNDYVVMTSVRCISIPSLLAAHGLHESQVSILSLDTEGTDADIITSLDLDKCAASLCPDHFYPAPISALHSQSPKSTFAYS
jgi:hypothetical protein